MNVLPDNVIDKIYRLSHEMQYSSVMRQLKQYRINTVFNVYIDVLEYGYYYHHGLRTPCINIDNINAKPTDILSLILFDNAVLSLDFSDCDCDYYNNLTRSLNRT